VLTLQTVRAKTKKFLLGRGVLLVSIFVLGIAFKHNARNLPSALYIGLPCGPNIFVLLPINSSSEYHFFPSLPKGFGHLAASPSEH
jgi:hypothetical protein